MNKTKSVTKQGVISLLELRGFKIDTEYSTEYDLILWPTKEYSIVAGLIYFDHVNIQHDKHAEITEKMVQAMAAGKNVISEKPVTLSSEDLQALIDASHKYNKILTVLIC